MKKINRKLALSAATVLLIAITSLLFGFKKAEKKNQAKMM